MYGFCFNINLYAERSNKIASSTLHIYNIEESRYHIYDNAIHSIHNFFGLHKCIYSYKIVKRERKREENRENERGKDR